MSTELRTVPETTISQTRFYGGPALGQCIQITKPVTRKKSPSPVDSMFDIIQLTRDEARKLAEELILFANDAEIDG